MKNDIIENIRLEMKNHKSRISISVHVGDVATRTLHITLADSGSLVTLENVLIAEIWVEKPDGKHCYNNCVIAGDEIQYTITSQTINVIGICKCEIRLTFEDGEVVTSPEFTIVVYDKNLNQNVVKSQNEYTALTEQVVMAKNYAKEAAKSLESIGDAEANAAASAERAEKAEDLARGHLENAEAVRDSVAADANSAREAAQGATASEETAQKLAEEIRAAVSGAVEASENANVSAQNAANSEVNAKQYEANAKTASEGIEEALINAVASAERAEEAEESAEVYAELAEESALKAGASEQKAENSEASAKNYAETAETSASEAEEAATKASASEQNAANSEQNAEKYAEIAQQGAETATSLAGSAELSELNAANSEANAKKYAEAAQESATNVAVSESNIEAIIQAYYEQSIAYTDKAKSEILGGLPDDALNTITELAEKLQDESDALAVLITTVGEKAEQAELDTHTGNSTIHVTATERTNWNDANDKKHAHSNKTILDGITSALITNWNNAVKHITDTIKHITESERTNWNLAYTHSISSHAPTDAQANQNAFGNVVVGSSTIVADAETDTLKLVAGSNVTIAADVSNDSVTISATNTKNTAGSTNSSSKLFLIGATSQSANPQTYSHDTVYIGTDGCLYSNGTKVSVEGHTHDKLEERISTLETLIEKLGYPMTP